MATSSAFRKDIPTRLDKPFKRVPDQAGFGVTITVAAGKTIVIEGDPIDHYFHIVSGSLRCYKAVMDGRRQIIDFLGPNDCFGLTGTGFHTYSVEAISDVIMIRYPRQRLEAAIEDEPDLGRQLFRMACSELDQAQRQMLLLGRKSAEERLASFLLSLAERQMEMCVELAMSRQDIADHLGLTIETVSRVFTRFKRAGLIDLPDRHSVTLVKSDQLEAMAEGRLAA